MYYAAEVTPYHSHAKKHTLHLGSTGRPANAALRPDRFQERGPSRYPAVQLRPFDRFDKDENAHKLALSRS